MSGSQRYLLHITICLHYVAAVEMLALTFNYREISIWISGVAYLAVGHLHLLCIAASLSGQVVAAAGNFQHGGHHQAAADGNPEKQCLAGPLAVHLRCSYSPSRHPSAPPAIDDLKPIHGPVPWSRLFLSHISPDILILSRPAQISQRCLLSQCSMRHPDMLWQHLINESRPGCLRSHWANCLYTVELYWKHMSDRGFKPGGALQFPRYILNQT